jgi:predicted CXXCH cytochrome family protein
MRKLERGKLGWAATGAVAVVTVGFLWRPAVAAAPEGPSPTFTKDVAPILQRSCQSCHNPAGSAPMSLLTYSDARPWAKAIKMKTAVREMPPFFIDKTVGIQRFKDDPSLSDTEIARIAKWVDNGAPEGNPADLPPARQLPSGDEWQIGQPDLVVSSPLIHIKAEQSDALLDLGIVPIKGLIENRWIQSVEFREILVEGKPGYRKPALHHCLVVAGSSDELGMGAAATSAAEANERARTGGSRLRISHETGQNPTIYGDTGGVMLKVDSAISFESVHLHPSNARDEVIRVDIGIKFYPEDYKPKYTQSGFLAIHGDDEAIDIPANTDNVRMDAYYRLNQAAIMTTFEPHMHSAGKQMCVEAIYPDNSRETLNCARYDQNWARVYIYEDDAAPLLPADTVLHVFGTYNNSPSNRNVEDPRNWKGWGNRTSGMDDMFILLPKMTVLTEEQYQAEVAARRTKAASSQERQAAVR